MQLIIKVVWYMDMNEHKVCDVQTGIVIMMTESMSVYILRNLIGRLWHYYITWYS